MAIGEYGAIVLTAAVAGLLGGSYYLGVEAGSDACEAAKARDNRVANVATAAAASAAASAIAGIKVNNVTIRQKTETQVRDVVRYRECVNTPDVMRNLNEALTGRAEPVGSGLVPRASAPGR